MQFHLQGFVLPQRTYIKVRAKAGSQGSKHNKTLQYLSASHHCAKCFQPTRRRHVRPAKTGDEFKTKISLPLSVPEKAAPPRAREMNSSRGPLWKLARKELRIIRGGAGVVNNLRLRTPQGDCSLHVRQTNKGSALELPTKPAAKRQWSLTVPEIKACGLFIAKRPFSSPAEQQRRQQPASRGSPSSKSKNVPYTSGPP